MSMPPEIAAGRRSKLGWEEFLELPEDGNRYEILDGELVVTPPPAIIHQRVLGNLNAIVRAHVLEHRLGEVFFAPLAVRLSPTTIAEPDLIFLSAARSGAVSDLSIDRAPDLLVEILSPSTAKRDRTIKAHLYAGLGVDHYWIVDPKRRRLDAFERDGAGYRHVRTVEGDEAFEPALFAGLRIEMASVWA